MSKKSKYSKLLVLSSAAAVTGIVVAAANPMQADASSNADQLVKMAEKLAGALKWEVSYEHRNVVNPAKAVDYPNMSLFNETKAALKAAEHAVKETNGKEKEVLEARLSQNVKIYFDRSVKYIDAVTAGKKILEKSSVLDAKLKLNVIDSTTEAAYHDLSREITKRSPILYKAYGKTTRDALTAAYQQKAYDVKKAALYPVSIKIEMDRLNNAIEKQDAEKVAYNIDRIDRFFANGLKEKLLDKNTKIFQTLDTTYRASTKKYEKIVTVIKSDSMDSTKPTLFGGTSQTVQKFDKTIVIVAGNGQHIKLTNAEINGDIIIKGDSTGAGTVYLDNVKVNKVNNSGGAIIVDDVADHSLHQTNVTAEELRVNDVNGSNIVAEQGTRIKSLVVTEKAGATGGISLESKDKAAYGTVELASKGTEKSEGVTLKGDFSESKVAVTGEGSSLKVAKDAIVKELNIKTEAKVQADAGAKVQAVNLSAEKKGQNISLAGDFKSTVVNITNANAAIKVAENTEIKEVKKDSSVTENVSVENKGKIETSTGVVVTNTPPVTNNPTTPTTPPSSGGSGQTAVVSVNEVSVTNTTTLTFKSDATPSTVTWNGASVTATLVVGETNKYKITVPRITQTENILVVNASGYHTNTLNYTIPVGTYGDLKVISGSGDLNGAIAAQGNNQTWIIKKGTYDIHRTNVVGTDHGDADKGSYLNISANGLTIIGENNPTITTNEIGTGNWQDQQLIVVKGNNVTIEGVNLIGNISEYQSGSENVSVVNKIIEVFGDHFTFRNSVVSARANKDGGTIYYSTKEGKTSTIENVVLEKGRISLSGANGLNLSLKDVQINLSGNSSESDGFLPIYKLGNANVTADNVVASVSANSAEFLQETLDNLPSGATLELEEGLAYELAKQLTITKPVTIIGLGEVTLKAAANTTWSTENGEKHLVAIFAGTQEEPVIISNIVIDADHKSHAVNTYNNANVVLDNVTINNGKGAGLTVNGSTVVATNLITNGNIWGAVNVDAGNGVTTPSVFTLNGGTLAETTQIWSDGKNVNATLSVTAKGYRNNTYTVDGTTTSIWTNKQVTIAGKDTLYSSIQEAIDAADPGATINVGAGTYELSKQLKITKRVTIIGNGRVILKPSSNYNEGTYNADKHLISINSVDGLVQLENLTISNAKRSGINIFESTKVYLKDIVSKDNAAAGVIVNNSIVEADNLNTSGNGWYGINVDNGSIANNGAPATSFKLNSGIISESTQIVSDKGGVTIVAPNYQVFIYDATKASGATITSWYGTNNEYLDTSVNLNFYNIRISDIDSVKFSLYQNNVLLGTRFSTGENLVALLKDSAQYWEITPESSYTNVTGIRTLSAAFMNRTEESENNGYWVSSRCSATNGSIPNGLVVEVVVDNVTYIARK